MERVLLERKIKFQEPEKFFVGYPAFIPEKSTRKKSHSGLFLYKRRNPHSVNIAYEYSPFGNFVVNYDGEFVDKAWYL